MVEVVRVSPIVPARNKLRRESLSDRARQRMIDHEQGGPIRADWLNIVFLHLEVDPAMLRNRVPIDLDLFEGRAFVSLVAFIMRRFRPRGSGQIGSLLCAPVARHGFLNVRTYVAHRDEPGIYFLTEWVSNPLSVLFGPRTYGLPYRWGRLRYEHDMANGEWRGSVSTPNRGAALEYRACNLSAPARSSAVFDYRHNHMLPATMSTGMMDDAGVERRHSGQFEDGSDYRHNLTHSAPINRAAMECPGVCRRPGAQPADESDYRHNPLQTAPAGLYAAHEGSLDAFLLERYTAYTRHRGVNRRFRIWHRPWKVVSIDATLDRSDLLDCIDTSFRDARLVIAHASAGVRDVWIGRPRRVE